MCLFTFRKIHTEKNLVEHLRLIETCKDQFWEKRPSHLSIEMIFLFLQILLMCKLWRITHKMSKALRALCKVCE